MMTQPNDAEPAVPPGAQPDQWVGGQRDVYAQIGYVATSSDLLACPAVTVVAEQLADGRLGCIDVMLDVAMGKSDAGLAASQARELAALLGAAADLADQWAGRPATDGPLDAARSAVMAAYNAFRQAPGNAGDYLRASLDSIDDAKAVLR